MRVLKSETVGGLLYQLAHADGEWTVSYSTGDAMQACYHYATQAAAEEVFHTLTASLKIHLRARQRIFARTERGE